MPSSTPPGNLDGKRYETHATTPGIALRLTRPELVALAHVLNARSEAEVRSSDLHALRELATFLRDAGRRRGWLVDEAT